MTTGQNKLEARRVYDVFNQAIRTGNMSLIDEVMSADAIDHNPAPGQVRAVEGLKETFTLFHTAFPDLYFTAEDQIAEGDKVVSRVIGRGTHKGDFQGMPATNKTVIREGIDILRLADGKVIERGGSLTIWGCSNKSELCPCRRSRSVRLLRAQQKHEHQATQSHRVVFVF